MFCRSVFDMLNQQLFVLRYGLGLADQVLQLLEPLLIALATGNGRADNQQIRARLGAVGNGVEVHAAVDLEQRRHVIAVAEGGQFFKRHGVELLSTEARHHAHAEDQIAVTGYAVNCRKWRGGIDGYACQGVELADLGDQLRQLVLVAADFLVNRDHVGSCVAESTQVAARLFHHQMDIQRQVRAAARRFDNRHAEREVGYEVAIHHIQVQQLGTRLFELADFAGQIGVVAEQNRRRDGRRGRAQAGLDVFTMARRTGQQSGPEQVTAKARVCGRAATAQVARSWR